MIGSGRAGSCGSESSLSCVEYMLNQEGKLDEMTVADERLLDMASGPSTHGSHLLRTRQEVRDNVAESGEVRRIREQDASARCHLVSEPTNA